MLESGTFFKRFASLSSFAIANERLYQVCSDGEADGPFLELEGERFALVPSPTLSQLEDLEARTRQKEVFAFKQEFVIEAFQQEIRSRSEIEDYRSVTHALEFILYEVLPTMIDTAHELGELLGVGDIGTKTGKEVMDEIVTKELKDIEEAGDEDISGLKQAILARLDERVAPIDPRIGDKEQKPTSLLGKIINNGSMYISHGVVFLLEEGKKEHGIVAQFDGRVLHATPLIIGVGAVEERLREALLTKWKREAVEEFEGQLKELGKGDKRRKAALERFADRKEFCYGNLGYIREQDHFYVYWEMPKFAMQHPLKPEQYHPFPPAKISVRINSSHGEIHSHGPYVANAMVHPTLKDWETPYQHICILTQRSFGNSAFDIVRHISYAINAFTSGLTIESLDRHGQRDENAPYFGIPLRKSLYHGGQMTREEAVQQGYRITNEWNLEGRADGPKGTR